MKSKSDVIYKLPLLVSLCALLVAVPLRVYQYFKILEPETGFYSTIDFSVYIIYALLGIAVITAIVIPLINRKKNDNSCIGQKIACFSCSLADSRGYDNH